MEWLQYGLSLGGVEYKHSEDKIIGSGARGSTTKTVSLKVRS